MIGIGLICVILLGHWLGDFIFQTHWMATNKSNSMKALLIHTLEYTGVLGSTIGLFLFNMHFAGYAFTASAATIAIWVAANGGVHCVVDFFTSRASAWAHRSDKINLFWNIIGFDQLLHGISLFVLWAVLVG